MGVVVRKYIDILIIIITFPYSTCISSFFGSIIPTSLFILKMFFRSLRKKNAKSRFLKGAIIARDVIHSFDCKSAVEYDGGV